MAETYCTYRIELKLALEQRRMTQAELAKRLCCTTAHVSRVVRGHITPNANSRKRIAKILGKSEIALFPGPPSRDPTEITKPSDGRGSS
jgi:transcriptional regulator with XRE-family HTH domain